MAPLKNPVPKRVVASDGLKKVTRATDPIGT